MPHPCLALFGLLLCLSGCGAPPIEPTGALLGANIAAIPVFHRDLFDLVWSTISGRDCSIVRLDRNQTYCKPPELPPPAPEYCTRSLGVVDCWAEPDAALPPEVASGPRTLSPAQEADRTRPWSPL